LAKGALLRAVPTALQHWRGTIRFAHPTSVPYNRNPVYRGGFINPYNSACIGMPRCDYATKVQRLIKSTSLDGVFATVKMLASEQSTILSTVTKNE
jgi:hypothetical protein